MAAIAGLSMGAYADTVEYTASFSGRTDWGPENLDIQQFDPALGTLNSVTVYYTGSLTSTGDITNDDAVGQTVTIELTGTVDLAPPAGVTGIAAMTANINESDDRNLAPMETISFTVNGGGVEQSDTTSEAGDLAIFTGGGNVTFVANASARSTASGSGNITASIRTSADAAIRVVYDYAPPVTSLSCSNSLTGGGDTVTATVNGSEACENLQFVETITCSGDLTYAAAASTPDCNVVENPNGTFTATCNVTINQNSSASFKLIDSVTGTDGTCTTAVTSMSCTTTPSGQAINADTSSCSSSHSLIPTPPVPPEPYTPPNVPTLSQWALMLLAGMLGMIGVRAQRRKS